MSALAVVTRPTDRDTDDRDLVAGVRAADDRAFELLFQRYQPRIAAYVRGMVHDHGRAEDITQEVFMSALRRMRETDRDIAFKPWIYEIARNACIDAYRRSRNASEVSFDARDAIGADEHGRLAEPGATPDSAVEGKVAIDNLCGAFGGLSPVHRDILVLREFEGLSYSEIGDRLGMSRPAVESTLFRARKRLTEEYEELVSGARCLRVQRIVDASDGRAAGLRDQRRMARHLAHCQPCRRYARLAGIDLGEAARPAAAAAAAARIAAFLPLPAFLRRRWSGADAAPPLGHRGGPLSQWSANVATMVDPGTVSSWAKAVATAATVAVGGVGAGAAFTGHGPLQWSGAAGAPSARQPGPGGLGTRPHPVATSPRRVVIYGAGRTPTAPGEQPGAAAPGAPQSPAGGDAVPAAAPQPTKPAGRALHSTSSTTQATGGATDAATGVGDRDSGGALKQVLQSLGGVGSEPGAAGGAGAAVAAGPGSLDGVVAPVVDAVGASSQAVQSTVESTVQDDTTATAVAGSVSSTVSKTLTSTTMALSSLG